MPPTGPGRPRFQEQMRELERSMLETLDMALAQVDRVVDAIRDHDLRLAQFVVADDDRIDGRYLEVHQGVLSLIALQAPVAGDLRLVTAVLHVITSIERIGDQCANVAKLLMLPEQDPRPPGPIHDRLMRMGRLVREELSQAREAFAERDVALAHALHAQDDEVDRLNRRVFRLAVEAGETAELREWAISMTLVARAFERIGDAAVDIGEQAVFVAEGHFRELADVGERVNGR